MVRPPDGQSTGEIKGRNSLTFRQQISVALRESQPNEDRPAEGNANSSPALHPFGSSPIRGKLSPLREAEAAETQAASGPEGGKVKRAASRSRKQPAAKLRKAAPKSILNSSTKRLSKKEPDATPVKPKSRRLAVAKPASGGAKRSAKATQASVESAGKLITVSPEQARLKSEKKKKASAKAAAKSAPPRENAPKARAKATAKAVGRRKAGAKGKASISRTSCTPTRGRSLSNEDRLKKGRKPVVQPPAGKLAEAQFTGDVMQGETKRADDSGLDTELKSGANLSPPLALPSSSIGTQNHEELSGSSDQGPVDSTMKVEMKRTLLQAAMHDHAQSKASSVNTVASEVATKNAIGGTNAAGPQPSPARRATGRKRPRTESAETNGEPERGPDRVRKEKKKKKKKEKKSKSSSKEPSKKSSKKSSVKSSSSEGKSKRKRIFTDQPSSDKGDQAARVEEDLTYPESKLSRESDRHGHIEGSASSSFGVHPSTLYEVRNLSSGGELRNNAPVTHAAMVGLQQGPTQSFSRPGSFLATPASTAQGSQSPWQLPGYSRPLYPSDQPPYVPSKDISSSPMWPQESQLGHHHYHHSHEWSYGYHHLQHQIQSYQDYMTQVFREKIDRLLGHLRQREESAFGFAEGGIERGGSFWVKLQPPRQALDFNVYGDDHRPLPEPTIPILPDERQPNMPPHSLSWWGINDAEEVPEDPLGGRTQPCQQSSALQAHGTLGIRGGAESSVSQPVPLPLTAGPEDRIHREWRLVVFGVPQTVQFEELQKFFTLEQEAPRCILPRQTPQQRSHGSTVYWVLEYNNPLAAGLAMTTKSGIRLRLPGHFESKINVVIHKSFSWQREVLLKYVRESTATDRRRSRSRSRSIGRQRPRSRSRSSSRSRASTSLGGGLDRADSRRWRRSRSRDRSNSSSRMRGRSRSRSNSIVRDFRSREQLPSPRRAVASDRSPSPRRRWRGESPGRSRNRSPITRRHSQRY